MGTAQRTDDDRVVIPNENEYEAADLELSRAFQHLEVLAWRLRKLLPTPTHADGKLEVISYDPDRPVTAADVGLLWSYIDALDTQLQAATKHRDVLHQALEQMDMIRLDQRVAEVSR